MSSARRILILGAAGQVGRELQRSFAGAGEIQASTREQCNLADPEQIRAVVREFGPDVILNAAAYTAVDRAETEREQATAINAVAPGILAEEARECGALLVHYSTDYVFDGTKAGPWLETDEPNPLSHYGATKLAGEQAIARVGGRYLIFRTSWVYGPHGSNFLLTMLRLGRERERLTVVDDQTGAPTTSAAIAGATCAVVEGVQAGRYGTREDWAGLYQMTCGGSTTWFGFASEIFARADSRLGLKAPKLVPIATAQWPTPATRPRNSVLDNCKLQKMFGVELPDWRPELERAMAKMAANH